MNVELQKKTKIIDETNADLEKKDIDIVKLGRRCQELEKSLQVHNIPSLDRKELTVRLSNAEYPFPPSGPADKICVPFEQISSSPHCAVNENVVSTSIVKNPSSSVPTECRISTADSDFVKVDGSHGIASLKSRISSADELNSLLLSEIKIYEQLRESLARRTQLMLKSKGDYDVNNESSIAEHLNEVRDLRVRFGSAIERTDQLYRSMEQVQMTIG